MGAAVSSDYPSVQSVNICNTLRDDKVSRAVISVRTGRKWRAVEAVQIRLSHEAILGTMAQGRAGLRRQAATRYDSASGKERWKLVEDEVRASVKEARTSRAVAMRRQGAWMKWEQAKTNFSHSCRVGKHMQRPCVNFEVC